MIARRRWLPWLVLLAPMLVPRLAAAQEVSLEALLAESQLLEGDTTEYLLRLHNALAEPPPAPEVEGLDIRFVYQSSEQRVLNGAFDATQSFHYQVTPSGVGRYEIPGPSVELRDGKTLRAPARTLVVGPPEDQDLVLADVQVEPSEALPLQTCVVTLRVFVRKMPGKYSRQSPISPLPWGHRDRHPHLQLPWVDDVEGLEGEMRFLTQSRERNRNSRQLVGFTINDLQDSPMSLFDLRPQASVFDLNGREATAEDVKGIPRLAGRHGQYWVYALTRRFTPRRLGTFSLGPSSVRGRFIETVTDDGEPTLRDVAAVAPAVELTVALPEAGRPADFQGAFGNYQVRARVTPAQAQVGDPLTLTLEVIGEGNLQDLLPPALEEWDEFTQSFKVYEATSETRGRTRLFTWSLRPTTAAVTAVPPIPFPFFDLDERRYVTVHSEALPLEIGEKARLDRGDIVTAPGEQPLNSDLRAAHGGLFANVGDPRQVRDEAPSLRGTLAYVAALPFAYAALAFVVRGRRRRREDPARARRRGAAARARERMREASAALTGGRTTEALTQARLALGGLLADGLNLAEAGLTGRDIARHLEAIGAPPDLTAPLVQLLDRFEAGQYGGAPEDLASLSGEAQQRLEQLIGFLRKEGRLS